VLVCAGAAIHRDRLVEWLWPHLPAARGLASLHTALHSLRGWLEPGLARGSRSSLLVTDGQAYRLVVDAPDSWDAGDFLALARAALANDQPGGRRERLLAAEAMHTGPFLPEWRYEDWAAARREQVDQVHRDVLCGLAEDFEAAGQAEGAVSRYERLLALEPERERWHRALMSAYAQAGERALALRQFHACRRILIDRLGVEPSDETRALYRELL
jgi:DNA-binding SARP family transcriptional activator